MAGKTLALWLAFAAVLWVSPTHGERLPRVLVLDTERPAPPGFVDALRIQAAGLAEVVTGGRVEGATSAKVSGVEAPLETARASVGVWVESSDDLHLVYVVTRRRNRALVEVVRLPGDTSPETDRALAIKVRDVLETVFAGAGGQRDLTPTLRPERAPGSSPRERPAPESHWSWLLQGGAAGVTGGNGSNDGELGAALATGARHGARQLFVEGVAGLWLLEGTDRNVARAAVRTRELELSLSLRGLVDVETFAVGAHFGFVSRVVAAKGTAPDGRTGEATSLVPLLRLGPELRWRATRNVDLRAAGGFDLALARQRFSVVGEPVTDLGTTRTSYELAVVVALP
jgi:hypothetical protein